jgi:hypothetical protein
MTQFLVLAHKLLGERAPQFNFPFLKDRRLTRAGLF